MLASVTASATCVPLASWADPVAISTLILAAVATAAIVVPILQQNGERFQARVSALDQAYHAVASVIASLRLLHRDANTNASQVIEEVAINRALVNDGELFRALPLGVGSSILQALNLMHAAVLGAVVREALPGGLHTGNRFAARQTECEAALKAGDAAMKTIQSLRTARKPGWLMIRLGPV